MHSPFDREQYQQGGVAFRDETRNAARVGEIDQRLLYLDGIAAFRADVAGWLSS